MANTIPVSRIKTNPNQPRTVFNDASLAELAESIRANGLIQPIVVEDNEDGTYTLVGGERRLRAHQLLGEASIQAEIRARSNHGGRELLIMGLVENIQREDMNPMDEAEAYQRLRDEYGMKWTEIARQVGKHQSRIQQMAQLTQYEPELKAMVRAGELSPYPDVTRSLLALPNAEARIKLARKAVTARMTIKQIIAAAEKLAGMFAAQAAQETEAASKVPAIRLARQKSRVAFDDNKAPQGWDALKQAGSVPAWKTVTETTRSVCAACSLSSMANAITCRDCPMVDFLVRVVRQ